MNEVMSDLLLGAGLGLLLVMALEVGFQAGRRARKSEDGAGAGQLGAIQGAVLGLLGLLLGFSFAAAGARFLERQDLITTESNAIGTAYLRANLLAEPHERALKDALERYTLHRIEVSARLRLGLRASDLEEVSRLQGVIWAAAEAGVADRQWTMMGVMPPVNDVIDTHSLRIAAGRKRLPPVIICLLVACSVLAVGNIGYGCGMSARRRLPLTLSLAAVICVALWITIDLDRPRSGILRLNDAPLKEIRFDPPGG